MASSASHLLLLAIAFLLVAVAAPSVDAWGGRLFFSKMTRPESAVVEADQAADTTTAAGTTESLDDANSALAAFAGPSSGGSNRGYGLYGRPEETEKYPPAYFRRGVHHDAEKRTTTNTNVVPASAREEVVPAEEQQQQQEEEKEEPSFPENGSGRGRPLSYMRRGGKHGDYYGMSDTRLYQNGRYYYDVETDKYGYGYESNPTRTHPEREDDDGSGYGRAGGERRSESYGDDAAGYENSKKNEDDFQGNQKKQYNP